MKPQPTLRAEIKKFTKTKEHNLQCIGYSEGQLCCLEKPEILDAILQLISSRLPEEKPLGYKADVVEIEQNEGYNDCLLEVKAILEGKE